MFEFHIDYWFNTAWEWAKEIISSLIDETLPSPFFIIAIVIAGLYLSFQLIMRFLKKGR